MKTSFRTPIVGAFALGALLLTRRLTMTWGTSGDEHMAALPGDERVYPADVVATRAVTIDTPVSQVWPWLVQIGQNRAGFYSYELLENIAGLDIHNADGIVDDWQNLAVGDDIHLSKDVTLRVVELERNALLLLEGRGDARLPFAFTWSFVVFQRSMSSTRLVVRERYRYTKWWGRLVVELVQPLSFLMTAGMLRGIRERAEANAFDVAD